MPIRLIQCTTIRRVAEMKPLSTSSPVDLFWPIDAITLTFYHHHTDECSNNGEKNKNEYNRYFDCPFSRREQVMQWMISINKRLQRNVRDAHKTGRIPSREPIGRSTETAR